MQRVSPSIALCVWPCNCYGPKSDHQPYLLWDLHLYERLACADAWAFIGPINWYGPTSTFKLLFDRLVCINGGNPRPDLIEKKNTLLAQALERSPQWQELSRNHLEGRIPWPDRTIPCAGAALAVRRKPYKNERDAYQGLVWQCRYSGIEVPVRLWRCASIGVVKPYADDQADALSDERRHWRCSIDGQTTLPRTSNARV